MALHVLGPVAMTEALLPALDDAARVVLVTSGGMYAQSLPADDPEYLHDEYSPTASYARSKRAQVELLPVLQERWPRLCVHATHPGWADTPGVQESLPTFRRLASPLLERRWWSRPTVPLRGHPSGAGRSRALARPPWAADQPAGAHPPH